MFNTYEAKALSTLRIQEIVDERRLNREIRTAETKRMAQRKLRRAVEKLLETDEGVQSVLDVINHVVGEAHPSGRRNLETSCCT